MQEDQEQQQFKLFFTAQTPDGRFSAFIQICGFESENEAKKYLANSQENKHSQIIENPLPTIH